MTIAKLNFNRVEFPTGEAWITGYGVGEYKVVQYGESWYAYIHKAYQSNWGNSCFHTPMGNSESYKTHIEAQEACQKHHNEA